jgi:hypothetical protein
VEGHVAAARHVQELDPVVSQLGGRREHMASMATTADTDRDDSRVLEE